MYGYQRVMFTPSTRELLSYSRVFGRKEDLLHHFRGQHIDQVDGVQHIVAIIGPLAIYRSNGSKGDAEFDTHVRDLLTKENNNRGSSLAITYPLMYIYDRRPYMLNGYSAFYAVVVQYSYWGMDPKTLLFKGFLDAIQAKWVLRRYTIYDDDFEEGPIFMAIIQDPHRRRGEKDTKVTREIVFTKKLKLAPLELCQSVKGIRCYPHFAEPARNMISRVCVPDKRTRESEVYSVVDAPKSISRMCLPDKRTREATDKQEKLTLNEANDNDSKSSFEV